MKWWAAPRFLWRLFGVSLLVAVAVSVVSSAGADAGDSGVSVTLSASPSGTVVPYQLVTYTLRVSNPGSADAGPVTITDVTPKGTANYVPGSATCGNVSGCTMQALPPPVPFGCTAELLTGLPDFEQGCNSQQNTLVWTLSSVPAGASDLLLSFQLGVGSGIKTSVVNNATWTGGGCASAAGCLSNEVILPVANVIVTPHPPAPVSGAPVSGTGSAPPNPPVQVGETLSYTLSVDNVGNAGASAISVYETVGCKATASSSGVNCTGPGPLVYVPNTAGCGGASGCSVELLPGCTLAGFIVCDGTTIVWTLASVPAQANIDLSFEVTVNSASPDTDPPSVTIQAAWNGGQPPGTLAYAPGEPGGPPTLAIGDACYGANIPDMGVPACYSISVTNAVSTPPTPSSPVPPPPPTQVSSQQLALTGPGAMTYWVALGGAALFVIGLGMLTIEATRRRLRPGFVQRALGREDPSC